MNHLKAFLTKDIKYKNEPKKAIVSVRLLYVILLIAFVLNIIWTEGAVFVDYKVQVISLLVLHIILFALTYSSRTTLVLCEFNLYVVAWVLVLIPCFGWYAGLQNYLMILAMLFFFATHVKILYKFLFAMLVLAFRIGLVFFYGDKMGMAVQGSMPEIFFELTNITAVFVCVVLFSYLYSKENSAAEDKLMKYNNQLEKAASTDPLTGLYNRRYTYEYLSRIIKDNELTSVSIAMGDIDFFKQVNDTYGHDAGDEVLKTISRTMQEELKDVAMISRWGGEEFLIVFPDINGDKANALLYKVHDKIGKLEIRSEEDLIHVTMTFGLTELDFRHDVDQSINSADANLYIGKTSGRNKIVF